MHICVHTLAPGGGLSPDGRRWISCPGHFFLPVRVLSRLFRGVFLHHLEQAHAAAKLEFHRSLQPLAHPQNFKALMKACRKMEWVVYAKPPFGGPQQVLDYLGRYTHRVAISNDRLIGFDNGKVTFRWRDYKSGNKQKPMTLDAEEFIRRFLLHVLPKGFVRIRRFGWLANAQRRHKLALCRELLGVKPFDQPQPASADNLETLYQKLTGQSLTICPACRQGSMVVIELIDPMHALYQPVFAIDSS